MLLLFLFFAGRSLFGYYYDPKYARDDYRGLVGYIARHRQPSDAVILEAPGQGEIFGYYARRMAPDLNIYPLPSQRPIDPVATDKELRQIANDHRRVWLVLWAAEEADQSGVVPKWLEANGRIEEKRQYGSIQMITYSLGPAL